MREVFEHAYEGFANLLVGFADLASRICRCVLVVLVYLAAPLWFIPYAIYKEKKGGGGS